MKVQFILQILLMLILICIILHKGAVVVAVAAVFSFRPSSSQDQESYYLTDSNPVLVNNKSSMSLDLYIGDVTNTASYFDEGDDFSNQETSNGNLVEESALPDNNLQPKKDEEMAMQEPLTEDKSRSHISKKRSRNAGDVSAKKKCYISVECVAQFIEII